MHDRPHRYLVGARVVQDSDGSAGPHVSDVVRYSKEARGEESGEVLSRRPCGVVLDPSHTSSVRSLGTST